MHVWQFIRLTSETKKSRAPTEVNAPDTKELGPAQARVLSASIPSVTEHTTRTLEPINSERKAE